MDLQVDLTENLDGDEINVDFAVGFIGPTLRIGPLQINLNEDTCESLLRELLIWTLAVKGPWDKFSSKMSLDKARDFFYDWVTLATEEKFDRDFQKYILDPQDSISPMFWCLKQAKTATAPQPPQRPG